MGNSHLQYTANREATAEISLKVLPSLKLLNNHLGILKWIIKEF